jgi:hypothetical protein
MNLIAQHPDRVVVIGTASRTIGAISKHAYIMNYALPRLGRKLITLCVPTTRERRVGAALSPSTLLCLPNPSHRHTVILSYRYTTEVPDRPQRRPGPTFPPPGGRLR